MKVCGLLFSWFLGSWLIILIPILNTHTHTTSVVSPRLTYIDCPAVRYPLLRPPTFKPPPPPPPSFPILRPQKETAPNARKYRLLGAESLRRKKPAGDIYMSRIRCVHPISAAHSPKLPNYPAPRTRPHILFVRSVQLAKPSNAHF